MSDNVIEAQGLTKRYGRATVVDGISFTVGARRDIRAARAERRRQDHDHPDDARLDRNHPTGKARVLGHDPAREPLAVKRRVGYLPDTVGFYDKLTAAENLRYTARLIGLERGRAREEDRGRARAHVGLADVADKRVGTFSRGMRQRLGLAEILMKDAQIAILDEPTSGLDPQATRRTARHHPRAQAAQA